MAAGSKANELSNMPDFNRKELAINAERCLRMAHRLSRLIQQHARVLESANFCERSCAPRILLLSLQLESLAATLPSCFGFRNLAMCLIYGGQNLVPLAFLLNASWLQFSSVKNRKSRNSCNVHAAVSVDGSGHMAHHLSRAMVSEPANFLT